ncbi:MAG: tRNA 2-thiouridine(34) synthase MnmA [Bacteroidota bacterium]
MPRVLVAMSGGVDSSVTAALLAEEGYEVVGITMKTWDFATTGGKAEARAREAAARAANKASGKEVGCCSLESMNDARSVALKRGFHHFVVDIRSEFGDWVIDRFTSDYLAGRTPNPCVLCNTHIKWAALLRRADDLGCDFIATGHYARVSQDADTGRYVIQRGLDTNKDQSYALWGLPQAHLARSIFPLGHYTKPQIRQMAADFGLTEVANKPDSYEICFIPDNDYRGFLKRRVEGLAEDVAGGSFVLEATGEVVGTHEGFPFYTVGQRRGLNLALGAPVYVTRIDAATNRVFVGPREALAGRTLTARQLNFVKAADLREEQRAWGKIRYKDAGAPCLVRQTGDDALEVVFEEPRDAITPGQSLVLYDVHPDGTPSDDVLAGGWIDTVGDAAQATSEFLALPVVG